MTDTNKPLNWIAEKILREEPEPRGLDVPPPQPNPEPEQLPMPFDRAAEQQAFADLLAKLADTDEGDADTLVTALSAEEFADDTFTPADQSKEQKS